MRYIRQIVNRTRRLAWFRMTIMFASQRRYPICTSAFLSSNLEFNFELGRAIVSRTLPRGLVSYEIDNLHCHHSRDLSLSHDLDIALLRTFVAIVDTGGLTSAGRRVGRTQPAITHQIKRLEDSIGRTLFDE